MDPETTPPWQAEVHHLLVSGRIEAASQALSTYLADHPRDVGALRQMARIAAHQGRPAQARDLLEEAAGIDPAAGGIDYELGVVHLALCAWGAAIGRFESALTRRSDDADAWFNLAWALRRAGRPAEAEAPLRRALGLRPTWTAAWFNLGNLLLDDLDAPQAAAAAYGTALEQAPDSPDTVSNLAMAEWRLGRPDEAEALLRRALALQPDCVAAATNLGNLLTAQTRGDEAVAVFTAAIARAPADPVPRLNLGLVLRALYRMKEAAEVLVEASRLAPDRAEIWNALGAVRLQREEMDAAADALYRAVALRPDYADAQANLANLASAQARPEEALAAFRTARALAPHDTRIHSNMLFFLIHGGCLGRDEVIEEHRRFGREHEAAIAALPPRSADTTSGRRLRVGYVSPDFCDHALTFWFEPVLELHDRQRFEVFCYACGPRRDHVTARLSRHVPHWRSIHALPADAAARLIRDDRIDILVDLAGHSANNALPVFIRKPAPIQATMIGYPFTTGLGRIDYCVSDIHRDPSEDCASDYTERVERLEVPLVFRPPADAPEPGQPPSAAGTPVRFGSFNKPQKLTAEVFDAWAAILDRCPGSTLLMVVPGGDDPAVQARFRALFAGRGITPGRIDTIGTCPLADFLGLVRTVDVALDPFPYGGGTTTVLTLWMGVPIITLDCATPSGRIAAVTLETVGLGHFVAVTVADYVAAAVAAAADPAALVVIRRDLRRQLSTSVIRAEHDYVRSLEAAYGRWWEAYLADLDSSGT